MKLLLSSSVAVTAAVAVLTLGRVAPLITLFHVGTRSRPTRQNTVVVVWRLNISLNRLCHFRDDLHASKQQQVLNYIADTVIFSFYVPHPSPDGTNGYVEKINRSD